MSTVEKWTADLSVTEALLTDNMTALQATSYNGSFGGTWDERRVEGQRLGKIRKRLKAKISRLTGKIAMAAGVKHYDIFNQELAVGCAVAWSTSGRYSGAQLGWITSSTARMVQVGSKKGADYGANVYPKALIVVDKLMDS